MPTGPIPPDQILDSALASFIAAMQGYLPSLLLWGTALLSAVVFCGLGYALLHAITTHDWFGMIMNMAWAFARVMVIYMLYQNFESIGSIFSTMGQTIGQQVSGFSPGALTPSSIYSMGLHIVSLLFQARHWGSWFNLIADTEFLFLIILTMIAWFAASLRWMFVLIETEWMFIKGAVTVCFAAFPHTWATLENWAVQMLRCGIKVIATLLVLAIGVLLAQGWTATLAALGDSINANPIVYGATQLCEACLVLWAVWHLPQKATHLIASGSSNGGGDDFSGREVFEQGGRAAATGVRLVA